MEHFGKRGDALWQMTDDELRTLAAAESDRLGLAKTEPVKGHFVIRQPKAYTVYDAHYRAAVAVIADWILSLKDFETVGRNGLHR